MNDASEINRIANAMIKAGGDAAQQTGADDGAQVCAAVRLLVAVCMESTGDFERAQDLVSQLLGAEFASYLAGEETIQ